MSNKRIISIAASRLIRLVFVEKHAKLYDQWYADKFLRRAYTNLLLRATVKLANKRLKKAGKVSVEEQDHNNHIEIMLKRGVPREQLCTFEELSRGIRNSRARSAIHAL